MIPDIALCAQGNLTRVEVEQHMKSGFFAMEQKFDGIRARIVRKDQNNVNIFSRNGKDITLHFADIALKAMDMTLPPGELILDGEIICINTGCGLREVQAQMNADNNLGKDFVFWPFDVVQWGDGEIWKKDYRARKGFLRAVTCNSSFSPVLNETDFTKAMDLYDFMQDNAFEGVVLKHLNKPYPQGRANNDWLRSKFKNTISTIPLDVRDDGMLELMVTHPDGGGVYVGAVQVPDDDLLLVLERDLNIIIEVEAYGCDGNGRLRHPTYKNIRFDSSTEMCTVDQLDTLRRF